MNAQDTSKHSAAGIASVRGGGGRKAIVGWEHMGEIAAVFESSVELTSSITPRTTISEPGVAEHLGDAHKQRRYPGSTRGKNGDTSSSQCETEAEHNILSGYRVNDNNNAVTRHQRTSGTNYEGIVRSASVVEERNVRSKDTSTSLTMTSSSTHAMDLFTSTPRPRTQNAPVTLDIPDFMPAVFEPETNGGGALEGYEGDDLLLRAREAEFTATLQPRSFDASIYATYTDLSSLGALGEIDDHDITYFDDEEEGDQRVENGEEVHVNGSIGSRESSERGSRTGLDPRPTDSRHLNKSLESILSEIRQSERRDGGGGSSDFADDLRLERTRSLEIIRLHRGFVSPSTNDRKRDSLPDNQSASLPDRVSDKETEPDRLTGVLLTRSPESTDEESRVCNLKGERVIVGENANVESPVTATPASATHSEQAGDALALSTLHTQRSANIHVNSDNYYDEDVSGTRSQAPMEDAIKTVDTEYGGKILHIASDKNHLPEQPEKEASSPGGVLKQDEVVAEVESGCTAENMEKKVAGDGAASAGMAEVESLRKEIRAWEEKYGALEKRVRSMDDSGSTSGLSMDVDVEKLSLPELQARVTAAETMIVDLRDQIECYKEEIEELQLELEEAADRVREGDLEEYRDLKHELDQVTKEWRILQYRLRKADRRVEQADQERQEWEEKCQILMMQMDEMQKQHMKQMGESGGAGGSGGGSTATGGGSGVGGGGGGGGSSERVSSAGGSGSEEEEKTVDKEILGLKQELKIAKDVSIRLHQELEMVEEKRARTEEENQLLRKKLVDSEATRKEYKRELEKTRLELHRSEVEFLQRKYAQESDAKSQELKEKARLLRSTASSDSSFEYDISALLNDLQESTERERDLQNQLQLVEEESDVIRKNLNEVEQEKEALEFELERFKMRFGTLEEPKRAADSGKGVASEKEAELRLQLMLAEQEATVMRRKLVELEAKNEELEGALARLSERLPDDDDSAPLPQRQGPVGEEAGPKTTSHSESGSNAEIEALRRHIEELMQENDGLRTKVEMLDEVDADYRINPDEHIRGEPELRAKLHQAERAITTLKKRLVESEYEGRTLQMEAESLRKLAHIAGAEGGGGGHGKHRGKSLETKLRAQVSLLNTEADAMRRQIVTLEIQNEQLQDELEKQMQTNVPSATSPSTDCDRERLEALQQKIAQLEEELGDLLLVVKSKDVTQEQQEKELQASKRECGQLRREMLAKESILKQRLGEEESRREVVEQQLRIVEERADALQSHLQDVCKGAPSQSEVKSAPPDVTISDETTSSTSETKPLDAKQTDQGFWMQRVAALERELAEERQRCRAAEKRAELLGGDVAEAPPQSPRPGEGEEAALREREKELLKFELNEYRMTIDELKAELIQERDERMAEKSEFDHKIAVIMEERERYDTLHELEKESSMIQLKMEGMKWRQERAQLFNRIDEVKAKMADLEKQAGGEMKHSTPGSSPVHSQREESQKLLQRLETEVEGLDGECWKYRQLADGLKNKMERLTAQNEELKASNDILTQERTILHAKLSNTEQEKSENDVRIKRERELFEMERDKLRDLQMERDELERILQPLQTRIDHLVADSEAVLNKKDQLENSVRTLSAMLDEAEEARQRAENALKEREHNIQNDSSRLRQEFEEELNLRVKDKNMRIDDLEKEVRTKSKEIENLNERLKSLERDLDGSRKSLDDFQKKDVAERQRSSPSGSPKGSPTRDPEQLRQKLATKEREWSQQRKGFEDTVDRLNSTLKARESAWDNERRDLKEDLAKAQQVRRDKEISWNAERAKLMKEIDELKCSLSKSESESKRQVNELRQRLEAATELVETYRLGETKFKEERRRLLQQIEDKESSVQAKQKEIERTQTQLSNQQKRLERVRVEILDRFHREEKVWKAEITASKFKLEAETKYFNDEVGSLQKRLENESNDYQSQKEQLNEAKSELDRLRAIVDNADKEKETLRSEKERENLAAKRSRQVLENAQQEKEKLATNLSQEKHRREVLQKTYASEKAGWEVSRNEMIAKIARLEQQTKLKKVKLEDLQARLQASWDQERSEHKRLLTEANYRVMEMQKEMERRDSQRSREGSASEGVLAKKLLEDERRKSTERIHELGAELQKSKDGHKRIGQLEARYQRDRELWRKERSDLQKRLQDSLATRRLEHNKLDSLMQELDNLKGAVEATDRLTRTETQNGGRHEQIIQKTVVKTTETKPLQKPPPTEENNAIYRQLRKQVSEPANVCATAAEKSSDALNTSAPLITHRHSTSDRPANFTLDENASSSARTGIEERSKSQSDVTRRDSGTPPKPPAKPPRQFSQKEESTSSTSPRVTSQPTTTPRQQTQGEYLQSRRSQSRSAEVLTSSPTKSPRSPVKVISSAHVGGGLEIATTKPAKASTTVKTVVTETKERRTQAPPATKIDETEHVKFQETHFGRVPHVTIIDKETAQAGKKTTVTEIVQESKTTVQESKVPVASSTPDVSQIGNNTSRKPQVNITRSVSDRRHDADKPTIVVKQGRFDVMGLLRETDRKTTRPRSESPSRVDLQIRLAELDRNRVLSTKMMFENSQPSTSGSAPALQRRSASTDSPCVSDTDSERHTDSEIIARSPTSRQLSPSISDSRLPGDSRAAGGASPSMSRSHESRASERPKSMCANIDRRSKPSGEVDSMARSSPYPTPPPGFLLPKHINGTTSKPSVATSPTVASARGVPAEPPRGKSYNVPIPPSELGSFGEGPLTHIPGQLPRTKSQLQAQSKQTAPPPLSDKTPPDSPKHGSERGKRVSPRSARAQFFSEVPSPTSNKSLKSQVAAQERKASNNNNNAAALQQQTSATSSAASAPSASSTKSKTAGSSTKATSSSGAKGASGGTVKGASGTSKVDTGTSTKSSHQPPSKASPWSASPAVSIPQQQRMGAQPATKVKKGKSSSKSSKK